MKKFFKNKKILFFIFLISCFSLSFGLIFAQYDYCQEDCKKYDTPISCGAAPPEKKCVWDATLNPSLCAKKLGVDWPASPLGTQISRCTNVTGMVKYFYEWGITIGGLVTFIALLIAGFQYLTSVGEPAKMTEAKNSIYSALFGLVLLLASWLILETINPQLTRFRADLQLVKVEPPLSPALATGTGPPCSFARIFSEINCTASSTFITPEATPRDKGLKALNSYIMYKEREMLEAAQCALPRGFTETTYSTTTGYITTNFTHLRDVGTKKYYTATETGTPSRTYICGADTSKSDYQFYELEPCPEKKKKGNCSDLTCVYVAPADPGTTEIGDSEVIIYDKVAEGFYIAGGNCNFAAYTAAGIFGWNCGEKVIQITINYSDNLTDYYPYDVKPEDIKCVRLIKGGHY